ncbi:MAG: hypothetical protein A4E55_02079 [Pelotomaculum sp. PtaU1.Bin035]|nr:MAG: hypothetical protein A4E55_02079 [Pelotomaculum sp. PtaU1.Bin035]
MEFFKGLYYRREGKQLVRQALLINRYPVFFITENVNLCGMNGIR